MLINNLIVINKGSKTSFGKMIKSYNFEIEKINSNSEKLKNSLEELKIRSALKMMKGFQDKEIPELESFNEINSSFENLIERIENQIVIAK